LAGIWALKLKPGAATTKIAPLFFSEELQISTRQNFLPHIMTLYSIAIVFIYHLFRPVSP
jgi:hypothetical protein